ncbi:EmrB/QacA subfamily drug resistance transporter [Marmoricola sp. URHA0025 HA25]
MPSPSQQRETRPWLVLGVASIAVFMAFLDTQVLFVAFNDIRRSYPSTSLSTMSWTLSAYTIALAATLVPAGRMADRFGRKRLFVIGLLAFTLASVLCALAPTAGLLVVFRVLQALGAATLLPSSMALVLSVFPRPQVPVAVAVWGSVGALAAAIGPTAGALLVHAWDWRAVFLANVPVGLIALVLAVRVLPESREAVRERFPDALGILLLAGALALMALGIVQSNEWHWISTRTFAALVGGAAILGWFVRRSLSVPHPTLDLTLFALPAFRWANIATFSFTIGFTATFFALIQFMTGVWHYDIVRAGLALMPGPVLVMILAPQLGRVAARFGQRALLIPGGLVYATSGAFLLTSLDDAPHWVDHMLPASLLSAVGVSMVVPHLTSAAVQSLPRDGFGAGSAVNQAIRQLAATFGVALTVALLGVVTPQNAVDHFQRVWWMLLASGVLTSLAALALPRRQRSPSVESAVPVAGTQARSASGPATA